MSKIKIVRTIITDSEGKQILKPNAKVISKEEVEIYRASLKTEPTASVLFVLEEME